MLVVQVVFPALLPLTYIPTLLARTKALFLSLFTPLIQTLVTSLASTSAPSQTLSGSTDSALSSLQQAIIDEKWQSIFDRCLKSCESQGDKKGGIKKHGSQPLSRRAQLTAERVKASESASNVSPPDSETSASMTDTANLSSEDIAKNVAALKSRLGKGKGGKSSSKPSSPAPSGNNKKSDKIMRKWGDSTSHFSESEMAELDFSAPEQSRPQTPSKDGPAAPNVDVDTLVDRQSLGQVGQNGLYEVADWSAGRSSSTLAGELPSEEEILRRGQARAARSSHTKQSSSDVVAPASDSSTPESRLSSLFNRLTGKKALTAQDLEPVLAEMGKHLMSKNVAMDIAEKLCAGVGAALVGKQLSMTSNIRSEVVSALSTTITQVLSPKTSTDILLDIKRKAALPLPPSVDPMHPPKRDPYTMTFVGVNGVGKSTNLSKVAFWLLQNKLRVLIAACDTFRSGAVEQLRVHVRNLGMLETQLMGTSDIQGDRKLVDLYERGYGKDAAGIAHDAIAYAKENDYDVVLIDTAGRMQDNEPLMRALAKLVTVNNPDKIVFVGEALVGNEAIDQLSKFDRSLKDFSAAAMGAKGQARGIDGMILTKFDTIVSRP